MTPYKKRPTRKDVAQAAGVSLSLVTYALDPACKHPVSAGARERILKIAAELDYVPSFSGRSLKSQHSFNIALVMPHELVTSVSQYYLQMFHSFCRTINDTEYQPVVFFGVDEKLLRRIKERRVDAIVLLNGIFDFSEKYEQLFENTLPKVFLNSRYVCSKPYTSSVNSDHCAVVNCGLDSLADAGCRRIMAVTGGVICYANKLISEAVQDWGRLHTGIELLHSGIQLEKNHYLDGEINSAYGSIISYQHGIEELDTVLEKMFAEHALPDGIFCDGDIFKGVIIDFYRKKKLPLPKVFWIDTISADNEIFVQQPYLLGSSACQEALRMVNSKSQQGQEILIPYIKNEFLKR